MKKYIVFLFTILLILIAIMGFFIYKKNAEIKALNNEITVKKGEINKLISEKEKLNSKIETLNGKSEANKINIKTQKCMESCNYTTACMSNCTYSSIDDWEKTINTSKDGLKKNLNKERYTYFLESEKAWEIYKDKEIKFLHHVTGELAGTVYSNILSAEIANIYEQRAITLNGVLNSVKQGSFVLH